MPTDPRRPSITRSKRIDRVVFAVALLLLVLGSTRLVVYAHVTPVRLSVMGVTSTGQQVPLQTPARFTRLGWDREDLEEAIRSYATTFNGLRFAEPFALLEWTMEYSVDSARFDKEYVFTTP
jgi:hypothetical protein